ncbi:transposase [Kitasatospora aureofaciens]
MRAGRPKPDHPRRHDGRVRERYEDDRGHPLGPAGSWPATGRAPGRCQLRGCPVPSGRGTGRLQAGGADPEGQGCAVLRPFRHRGVRSGLGGPACDLPQRAGGWQREKEAHDAIQKNRTDQRDPEWQSVYQHRQGIEGTISQGVRAFGLRRSR